MQLPGSSSGRTSYQPVLRQLSGVRGPADDTVFDPREARPARTVVDQSTTEIDGPGPHHAWPRHPSTAARQVTDDRSRRGRPHTELTTHSNRRGATEGSDDKMA